MNGFMESKLDTDFCTFLPPKHPHLDGGSAHVPHGIAGSPVVVHLNPTSGGHY
jgi:hypothetical protein